MSLSAWLRRRRFGVRWADDSRQRGQCPNCGFSGEIPVALKLAHNSPDHPERRQATLLHCPACGVRFYDDLRAQDYSEAAMLGRGRVPFHVQQGAGLSLFLRPLAMLPNPPGARYLEIGCGYGFALDYACHWRGWRGAGVDPGQITALGAAALDVPISPRLFTPADADGSCDIVMAAETLEHVADPPGFVAMLRQALAPGGVLVLTTPDGAAIIPGASEAVLLPLLQPGLHLVLQTPQSLEGLLRRAGFAAVEVLQDGHALIAFAADHPLALRLDASALRADLRAWLLARAAQLPAASDAGIGYAGRALVECVNDADLAGAATARAILAPALRERYGIALDADLPASRLAGDLETLARAIPLNLGPILYAEAIAALLAGAPRPTLSARFAQAEAACAALNRALRELRMDDAQAADIGWTSRMEALICRAAGGDDTVARDLENLSDAPGTQGAARRAEARQRVLVALVNAGRYRTAAALAARDGLQEAHFAQQPAAAQVPISRVQADTLFALAVLDIHHLRDPASARRRFRRVQRALAPTDGTIPPPDALFWAALRGEFQAADTLGDQLAAFAALEDALAVAGTAAALPDDLAALWPARLRDGFMRHIAAGDLAAARALDQTHNVAALAASGAGIPPGELNGLRYALAALDAGPGGDGPRARAGFAALRRLLPPADPLFWPVARHELAVAARDDGEDAADLLAAAMLAETSLPPDTIPPDIAARATRGRAAGEAA